MGAEGMWRPTQNDRDLELFFFIFEFQLSFLPVGLEIYQLTPVLVPWTVPLNAIDFRWFNYVTCRVYHYKNDHIDHNNQYTKDDQINFILFSQNKTKKTTLLP